MLLEAVSPASAAPPDLAHLHLLAHLAGVPTEASLSYTNHGPCCGPWVSGIGIGFMGYKFGIGFKGYMFGIGFYIRNSSRNWWLARSIYGLFNRTYYLWGPYMDF